MSTSFAISPLPGHFTIAFARHSSPLSAFPSLPYQPLPACALFPASLVLPLSSIAPFCLSLGHFQPLNPVPSRSLILFSHSWILLQFIHCALNQFIHSRRDSYHITAWRASIRKRPSPSRRTSLHHLQPSRDITNSRPHPRTRLILDSRDSRAALISFNPDLKRSPLRSSSCLLHPFPPPFPRVARPTPRLGFIA